MKITKKIKTIISISIILINFLMLNTVFAEAVAKNPVSNETVSSESESNSTPVKQSVSESKLPLKTGYEVMKEVRDQSRKYETRIGKVKISIKDKKNRERERYFRLYKKFFDNDEDRSLIKFFRPANVKGMALLSKSIDVTTRQWLYMPAFKSTKLLSSQDQNKSFMGSDFTYSDIAGRQLDQDSHKLIKETDKYYFVESLPNDSSEFYSKMRYVISKAKKSVLKVIFYDNKERKLKTLSNKQFKQYKDIYIAVDSYMDNHQTKGATRLLIEEISVGKHIANELVGQKGLKQ